MSGELWATNTTIGEVAALLREAGSVAVVTHSKPDGDALGSALGAALALRRAGVDATAVFPGPWVTRWDALVEGRPCVALEAGEQRGDPVEGEPGAILVVDTGSWSQLRDVRPWLEARRERVAVLDHHPSGDAGVGALRVVEPGRAAACELVAELACALLRVRSASELPAEVAELLYLGIATDTGWFRHSNVSAASMRLAADLLDAGVDHTRIVRIAEENDRPERLRLMARALTAVEFVAGGGAAVMALTGADFEASGAGPEDAGGLTDVARAVRGVSVVALLYESGDGEIKLSLRSKAPAVGDALTRDVDVNAMARSLGGGGHVRAAGARMRGPMDDARRRVVAMLEGALE